MQPAQLAKWAKFAFHLTWALALVCPCLPVEAKASLQVEQDVYKMCSQGNTDLAQGRYEEARQLLEKAAAYDPTSYSASVHENLSDAYHGLKEYQQALAQAELAVKYDPSRSDVLYNLGIAYNNAGQYAEAISALRKYSALAKDASQRQQAQSMIKDLTVFKDLHEAQKYLESGANLDRARQLLLDAAAYDPSTNSGKIHANLSNVFQQTGHPERAIEEGHKSCKYDPLNKYVFYNLALAYQDIGDFENAIKWFNKYLALETDGNERNRVQEYVDQLSFDKSKQTGDNSKPDYYDQLKSSGQINQWFQDKLPLKVYIASGSGIEGYRKPFRSYIIRALDTWCTASGSKLNYTLVDDKNKADIDVEWTHDPITMTEGGKARRKAGLTTPQLMDQNDGAYRIKSALVQIQTARAYTGEKVPDGQMAATCMHEIGHAMGLGHSTCVSDIMYFGASSKQSGKPTKRDRLTIARLYADFPAIAFTPKLKESDSKEPVNTVAPLLLLPPKPPPPLEQLFMSPPPPASRQALMPPLFTPTLPAKSPKQSDPDIKQLMFQPSFPSASKTGKKAGTQKPSKASSAQPLPPLFTPSAGK